MRSYQSQFRSRALVKKNPTIDLGNTDAFPELGASKVDPISPIGPVDPVTLWKTTTINEPLATPDTLANKNWSREVVDTTFTESPGWVVLTSADTYNRSVKKGRPCTTTHDTGFWHKKDEEEEEGEEDTHESIHAGFQRVVNIHKRYVAEFIETHGYEYYAQNYLSNDTAYRIESNKRFVSGDDECNDATYDDDNDSCDEDW